MKLELLDSHQTEQLSACRLSLILGAYTPDNKIERYLKIVRAILNVENAFLAFTMSLMHGLPIVNVTLLPLIFLQSLVFYQIFKIR